MKILLLGCGLVAALPGVAQRPAPVKRAPTSSHSSADANAYSSLLRLGGEAARLLRRAMAETDDAKAVATINSKKAARLKEKAEQLQPHLRSWVNTLSEQQKEEFGQRFLKESPLAQCLDSLEHNPTSKARIERSPSLQNAIQALFYYTL